MLRTHSKTVADMIHLEPNVFPMNISSTFCWGKQSRQNRPESFKQKLIGQAHYTMVLIVYVCLIWFSTSQPTIFQLHRGWVFLG